jgi:hypothetical protein
LIASGRRRGTDRGDCVVTTADSDAGGNEAGVDARDYRVAEFGNRGAEFRYGTAEYGTRAA